VVVLPLLVAADDPPLVPSGSEGRGLLRRELLEPQYHQQDYVRRLVDWLERTLFRGIDAVSGQPPLTFFFSLLIFLGLVLAAAWLASRARTSARARPGAAVFTEQGLTAAQLHARAHEALSAQRWDDALLDGFRALALRQVEQGRIDDRPGATAHELVVVLAERYPDLARRFGAAGTAFDLVAYGRRAATPDQARAVLALDDDLLVVR
jgi:hypothetical protein